MKKVIIAEDEDTIREFIVINLERSGYSVIECNDGSNALEKLKDKNFDFDIAILDIMMSGMSGIDLCKVIRKETETMGIVILTAKSQEIDKVSGLMYGADDYIVKPFSPSELLARIDALYRRVSVNSKRSENNFSEKIRYGNFELDLLKQHLKKDDETINLTKVEFQMMELFLSNPGKIFSRQEILHNVWNDKFYSQDKDKIEKIVDVNIRRIRSKIENDPAHPQHISTIWGIGYRWEN